MIEAILPAGVVAVDFFHDPPDVKLFPEEERLIERAVDKRRREFTTGRHCAREALGKLGLPASPLPSGPRGEPLWPAGVVGSITHCTGYRGAALGRLGQVRSIGIDAEPNAPLTGGVLDMVSLPEEREALRALEASRPGVHWERLLFSAKESVYKAWYPLAGRWLGFEDAVIDFDPDRGTFSARLLVDGPEGLEVFPGRWMAGRGLVLTAVVL